MQNKNPNPLLALLTKFTQTAQTNTPEQTQLTLLTTIKSIIMINPNNYHHQFYNRVTFVQIYQFVIECLSFQYCENVLKLLLYVLAVMVKYWVQNSQQMRQLYDGILTLVQQRMYCGENCMRFFVVLVQTMQESYYNNTAATTPTTNSNNSMPHHCSLYKFSMMPTVRTNLQNYFMYHLLNQMLAFSNIFLDKCVVRNNKEQANNSSKKANRNSQQSSRLRSSRASSKSFGSGDRPYKFSGDGGCGHQSLSDQLSSQQQQHQLYTLCQPESVILSILTLIRVCLSYDFSHTARYHQQSEYQPTKSPIILPTKYSKYCRFSQYDIFLKNQSTTQMLNYLYLISTNVKIKLEVLEIIKSMSRIHFRYFKNKTFHKLHLEDIGYVLVNLLTGLDLNQPMSVCISGNVKVTSMDRCSKVSIGILLAELVSILFYHQPTFYLTELSLVEWLFDKVGVFIIEELLEGDYFFGRKSLNGNRKHSKSLSKQDLSLLIQNFIGQLPKLADYCKIYLRSNQQILEKVNQMYIKIGQKYYDILCQSAIENPLTDQDRSYEKYGLNRNQIYEESIMEKFGFEQSSRKFGNTGEQRQGNLFNSKICIPEQDKQQTQTNVIPITRNLDNNTENAAEQNSNTTHQLMALKKQPKMATPACFVLALIRESGSIHSIRNILNIFRVYCPQYVQLDSIQNNTGNLQAVSSNLSYTEHKQPLQSTPPPSNRLPSTYKNGQYQRWMISWLCNFQNHFHVTAGHARQPQKWQIQLHYQMMLQLLADLENSINIYATHLMQKQSNPYHPNNQQEHQSQQPQTPNNPKLDPSIKQQQYKQLNQCILVIALYTCDKIMYDCRISVQEYVQFVRIDVLTIVEWLCCNVGSFMNIMQPDLKDTHIKSSKQPKNNRSIQNNNNFNLDFEIQLDAILQLLNNINYYQYFDNYYKNRKQQQWKLELFYRCLQNLHEFTQKLCVIYAECRYEEISENNVNNYVRILYLLLKNYVQAETLYCQFYKNTEQQHSNQLKNNQITANLARIFVSSPQTLYLILQELNTQNGYNHRYRKQFTVMYLDIIRKKCIEADGKLFGYFYKIVSNQGQRQDNQKLKTVLLGCLRNVVQLDRKVCYTDPTSDILHVVGFYTDLILNSLKISRQSQQSNCACHQQLYPLLKLLNDTNPSKQPHHRLITLLKQVHNHSTCLQQLQLSQLASIVSLYINLTNIFNTDESILQQSNTEVSEQQKQSSNYIFVVRCCVWIMQLVKNVRKIYQCGDGLIIRMEQQIVEFVCMGYGGIDDVRYHGVLRNIEDVQNNPNYQERQNNDSYELKLTENNQTTFTHCLQHNISNLLTEILYFILTKATETTYIFPQLSQPPINHPEQHQYLKVDNMIIIFTLYHQLLQIFWKRHEDLVRKVVSNSIILDSFAYLGEKGVGWIVRKLEEWNVVVVPAIVSAQQSGEVTNLDDRYVSEYDNDGNLPQIMQTPDKNQQNSQQNQIQAIMTPNNKSNGNIRQNTQQQDELTKNYDNYQKSPKKQPAQQKEDSNSCPTAPFPIADMTDSGAYSSQIQLNQNNNPDDERSLRDIELDQKSQFSCKEVDVCKEQEKSFITCSPNSCRIIQPGQFHNHSNSNSKNNSQENGKFTQGCLDNV